MARYTNIPTSRDVNGQQSYDTNIYPEIPFSDNDIYVVTELGDRLDILANQYYGNSTYWWIISSANYGLKQDSYYLPQGVQIRIPANVDSIIRQYENENN